MRNFVTGHPLSHASIEQRKNRENDANTKWAAKRIDNEGEDFREMTQRRLQYTMDSPKYIL